MTIDFDKPLQQLLTETPCFSDDPAIDRLHGLFLALAEEVAVQSERTDSLEALLIAKGILQPGELDAYQPSDTETQRRLTAHQAFAGRLLSILEEDFHVEK